MRNCKPIRWQHKGKGITFMTEHGYRLFKRLTRVKFLGNAFYLTLYIVFCFNKTTELGTKLKWIYFKEIKHSICCWNSKLGLLKKFYSTITTILGRRNNYQIFFGEVFLIWTSRNYITRINIIYLVRILNMKMTIFIFREWKKKYWYYLYSEKWKV